MTAATTHAPPLARPRGHSPWIIAIVVSMATFMEVLDTSIANVSLAHIAGSLSATYEEATWVLTSYLLSNAIILPISGWLSNVIGRRRFYMLCVALFTGSSFLCGLAPSLGMLIVFRVLQGMGGGGLAPSEQAILADTFPPEKRGQAFAMYGVAVVVAPVIGPTLGGWITDHYNWRWIFFINVPVGLVSLFLSHTVLPHDPPDGPERRTGRIDYLGFGLVAIGLGFLQVVLDKGQEEDWFSSPFIVWFAVISGISLVLLVIREFSIPDPIVDVHLLKDFRFLMANIIMLVVGFILFGTTQLIPQFLQSSLGYTATQAGLVLSPGGLGVIILMPVVGYLVGKVQAKYLVIFGMVVTAAAMWHMTSFNLDLSFSDAVWARVFQSAGLAFLFVPINTAAYAGLPPGKNNNASALINLFRNLGGSFGISAAQTMLARRMQFHHARLVSHIDPLNYPFRTAIRGATRALGHSYVPGRYDSRALDLIHLSVVRQSSMLAYIDIFHLMAIASLLAVVLVLFLRKTRPGEKRAVAH